MQRAHYVDDTFGTVTREPGNPAAFDYFLPRAMPREWDPTRSTILALSDADSALGLLNGLGALVPDPDVLLGPFLTREALASSRIEGTRATLPEVLRAEVIDEPTVRTDDTIEVAAYLRAVRVGLKSIETLPISQRLLLDVHRELLGSVRGRERQPGEFRRSPVWIGAAGDGLETARYVPPAPVHLPDLLRDWEIFVNEPPAVPVLVRAALMHYQFETIHPFLDGNGRLGRLLIGLMLIAEGRLSKPLLYLSGYLETHRQEYYERLQAVRERGQLDEYLQFFLVAVRDQATDAVERARRLVSMRERYFRDCELDRSRVAGLIPLIFTSPFLTVARVQQATQTSDQGARNLIKRAQNQYGWLTPAGSVGQSGRAVWVAEEILTVVDSPLHYDTE